MLKVTFDNNVFSPLVVPERNPGMTEQTLGQLEKIKIGIKNNQILPFYSEAIFGIELLNKKIKHKALRNAKLHAEWKQNSPDHMTLKIGIQWGNREDIYKSEQNRMDKASEMGFKALIGPRHLGGLNTIPNFHLPYAEIPDIELHAEKAFEIECAIFNRNLGRRKLIRSCEPIPKDTLWTEKLSALSDKIINEGINEWADADAIVAHYSNNCDIFCTEDRASNSGKNSILHEDNRDWLEKDFKIHFASIDELTKLVEKIKD